MEHVLRAYTLTFARRKQGNAKEEEGVKGNIWRITSASGLLTMGITGEVTHKYTHVHVIDIDTFMTYKTCIWSDRGKDDRWMNCWITHFTHAHTKTNIMQPAESDL